MNELAVADLDTRQPPTNVSNSQICCLKSMTALEVVQCPTGQPLLFVTLSRRRRTVEPLGNAGMIWVVKLTVFTEATICMCLD